MSKIVLATPIETYKEKFSIAFNWKPPNIELATLAGFLRSNGFNVAICDMTFAPWRELQNALTSEATMAIVLTAVTEEIPRIANMIKDIRVKHPRISIILMGSHASAVPARTLEELPELDFIVIDEPEETMLELLKALSIQPVNDLDYKKIKGLAYRAKNREIIINPSRPRIKNLDLLPFPAWDLFNLDNYNSFINSSSIKKRKLELIVRTQRGCPYSCIFCQSCFKIKGPLITRTIENVMAEIQHIIDTYHPAQIAFIDDTFTYDRQRTVTFCKEFIRRGFSRSIVWACATRVDRLDPSLLRMMRAAGCNRISLGIESGNRKIQDIIGKRISIEQAKIIIATAKSLGITTHCGFILGHPYETPDSLKDTLKAALKISPDVVTFSLLTPFPGTKIYEMAQKGTGGLILLAHSWVDYDKQMGKSLELKQIPFKFLKKMQIYYYFRFYLHPKRIRNIFRLVNIKAVPNYLFGALFKQ